MTVAENIFLGREPSKGLWVSHETMEKEAQQLLDTYHMSIDAGTLVKDLTIAQQQMVEIIRALMANAQVVIMDEPTRGIDIGTKTEIQKMVIQLAREQHMSIIFISSEIDEMTRTCTRLAVLRDRRKVAELTGDDINSDRVMAAIAGGA